jgi:hypothetical protein
MLYWEDVSNMDHYFFTAENPAEGAAFTYHLAQAAKTVKTDRDRIDRGASFAKSQVPVTRASSIA